MDRYELLLKERDEAIEERDMYFTVLGTRGEALRNMEDENTTLKEENARLKTTIARGGGSSDAKNLKTVNNTLMHQNTQLSQENKELKKENKEGVKKVKDLTKQLKEAKPTDEKVKEYKEVAELSFKRFKECTHDFNRMRMLKEGLEKDLNAAKTAGADKTLAKTLKNLEDKVFSQVGLGACFIHLFL